MAEIARNASCCGATSLVPNQSHLNGEAIEGAGVGDGQYVISNMHCPACAQKIERALRDVDGLMTGRVNIGAKRLHLVWDTETVRESELLARVEALGYELRPFARSEAAEISKAEERRLMACMAVAGFSAANVMLISVAVWSGLFSDMGTATRGFMHWLSAMIALPAVVIAGRPFYESALNAVRHGGLNMDVPIALAVVTAACMSLYETVTNGEHVYFDASVTLLFFLLIGRFLDFRMRAKARAVAENLMVLQATHATVIDAAGNQHLMPVDDLEPGMQVAVAAGERIPVDGIVSSGRSDIDESLITGESVPRSAGQGDALYAGAINVTGPVTLGVTAAGDQTLLADIVRMLDDAEKSRADYVRFADRLSRYYAPVVHILSAAAFLYWWLLGGMDWQPALLIGVTVLIITCPCALGLAVPAVQAATVGRLMRQGLLVKSGDALERLTQVDTVVFDKTGTLTLGAPELVSDVPAVDDFVRVSAALARQSRHPLARALAAALDTVPPTGLSDVEEVPGRGVQARWNGSPVRMGSREFCGIAENAETDAGTHGAGPEIWVDIAGQSPRVYRFRDQLRPDAAQTVAALKRAGKKVLLLSGDRTDVVRETAALAGIDHWSGQCRPDDKVARLNQLAADGQKVLMIGDGLNDAPALASAFVSASPAEAADISQTTSDMIIQGAGLRPILDALVLAGSARRLATINIALALTYNIVAIPVAVMGMATPLVAAIAMSSSSIIVTLNALRVNLVNLEHDDWTR